MKNRKQKELLTSLQNKSKAEDPGANESTQSEMRHMQGYAPRELEGHSAKEIDGQSINELEGTRCHELPHPEFCSELPENR